MPIEVVDAVGLREATKSRSQSSASENLGRLEIDGGSLD